MAAEVNQFMTLNVSETQFEKDIETSFLSNGYRKLSPQSYNIENMIFKDVFIEFVKTSQAKAWARYEKLYGIAAPEKIIRRLNDSISSRGLIEVLKHGFSDMGIDIDVCYSKPESSLNDESNKKYLFNIVGETRQFRYSKNNNNEIDMVLSINGIPVIAFELKNQFKGQDYLCAIEQWKNDRDPRENVFKFNTRILTFFAVDLYDVWMTTELSGPSTRFLPFNQGSNGAGNTGGKGNPTNEHGYPTSYLWEEVFAKDSFIDLIFKFITITEEKKETIVDGELKKKIINNVIFPRYHQYDVVRKIVNNVRKNGPGRNYLIEHSAGSGKSNSIAWITYRLASLFNENDEPIFDSVIIVTNRIVLDSQLQDTINSFEHKAGLVECITQQKGGRGLAEAINDKRKIIISTVQKFLFAYKEFDNFNNRNFAIIIDEAHQGQSGESARTLKKSLTDIDAEFKKYLDETGKSPDEIDEDDELLEEILAQGQHSNQSFFAFTATPISKTLQVFGELGKDGKRRPFHVYSMRQAIEEGFILDVLQDYLTIEQAFKIIKDSEDNPELIEGKTKRALFNYYKGHDFTIEQKVDMIMDNFLNNGRKKIDGHGKAIVVCSSRHQAVKFYFAIKDYIKNHKEACEGCDALVAFSGMVKFDDDPTEYVEVKMNKDHAGHYINSDRRFRKAFHSDEFNIMVVANKYQTGYDEPYLHSMYIDKKLRGVNAVQTLSRLNRTCKGKVDTFVLDFENSADDIKKAFEPFYSITTLSGDMDVNRVYDLRAKVGSFALFSTSDVDAFTNIMVTNSGKKKQDATAVGKIASILKPVVERYVSLKDDNRLLARDTLMKFVRCFAFVTQLVRIDDKDLFKDYLFVSHLVHLLPKTSEEKIDITDKISLEYAKLKETFHGAITLEGGDEFNPPKNSRPKVTTKKVDTLQRIINKVNEQYEGDFGPADKVAIDSLFAMLMSDTVVKEKLKDFAKNNDINMFISSIFPGEFQRILIDCYKKNDEAFNRLLDNDSFQKAVMSIMAKEIYKALSGDK